jgi:hypothetical protein
MMRCVISFNYALWLLISSAPHYMADRIATKCCVALFHSTTFCDTWVLQGTFAWSRRLQHNSKPRLKINKNMDSKHISKHCSMALA